MLEESKTQHAALALAGGMSESNMQALTTLDARGCHSRPAAGNAKHLQAVQSQDQARGLPGPNRIQDTTG